eukprot:11038989-Alexandrium_andersonii.AAC.1
MHGAGETVTCGVVASAPSCMMCSSCMSRARALMLCSSCVLAAMTSTWMLAWGIGCCGGAGVLLPRLACCVSCLACLVARVHSSRMSASDHMCHVRL